MIEFGFPRRTSSYQLEMRGYELLQNQVRFSAAPIIATASPARDSLLRRCHKVGRTGDPRHFWDS